MLGKDGTPYGRCWALIYDQWNETGDRSQRRLRELQFYRERLEDTRGAVLEAACGTGSIMLPLLQAGLDIYGFDASLPMLEVLRRKATQLGVLDIEARITRQDLADFVYNRGFDAVIIPASSFMLLATQDEQIACLQRVHSSLRNGGRLLLNFYVPSLTGDLLLHQDAVPEEEEFGEFTHPETGTPIQVSSSKTCDLTSQTETYTWVFRNEGDIVRVPMQARWIHKEEFQLLLRLGGFRRWEVFGSHNGEPYVASEHMGDTYWTATK